MKPENVRITVDLPASLYRRLKEQAAAQGCSASDLILRGVEILLFSPPRPMRHRVQFPLIRSRGPKVSLSNDRLYEHVDFRDHCRLAVIGNRNPSGTDTFCGFARP